MASQQKKKPKNKAVSADANVKGDIHITDTNKHSSKDTDGLIIIFLLILLLFLLKTYELILM